MDDSHKEDGDDVADDISAVVNVDNDDNDDDGNSICWRHQSEGGQRSQWTKLTMEQREVEVEVEGQNKKTNYGGSMEGQWRVRTNKETMNGHWPYMVIEQCVWTFAENLFDRMC